MSRFPVLTSGGFGAINYRDFNALFADSDRNSGKADRALSSEFAARIPKHERWFAQIQASDVVQGERRYSGIEVYRTPLGWKPVPNGRQMFANDAIIGDITYAINRNDGLDNILSGVTQTAPVGAIVEVFEHSAQSGVLREFAYGSAVDVMVARITAVSVQSGAPVYDAVAVIDQTVSLTSAVPINRLFPPDVVAPVPAAVGDLCIILRRIDSAESPPVNLSRLVVFEKLSTDVCEPAPSPVAPAPQVAPALKMYTYSTFH